MFRANAVYHIVKTNVYLWQRPVVRLRGNGAIIITSLKLSKEFLGLAPDIHVSGLVRCATKRPDSLKLVL